MMNKQILIIEITSYCNSRCEDCLRAGLNDSDYMLSFKDIKTAIKEIKKFSNNYTDFELKISGGEPTIWLDKTEKKDITDILLECENNNLNYALVTNGKVFSNKEQCKEFFDKIKYKGIHHLKLFITIDKYHGNYTSNDSNIILDNVLELNELESLECYVQSTVTKRNQDNLSLDFIEKYTKKGIKFMLNPLLPWGRGKNLIDVVPYVNLNNNDKSTLGDYENYYYVLGKVNNIWDTYDEFLNMNNLETLKRLNCCGKTITLMGNKYYYSMPCSGKEEFCFATIGNLDYKKYLVFKSNNKTIKKMANNKIANEDLIDKCPIGYGICGLCMENDYEL